MADKMKVSPEWTDKERLQLIVRIANDHLNNRKPMMPATLGLIAAAAGFGSEFIELNRNAFKDYIEVGE
jgi:hypothetical protein